MNAVGAWGAWLLPANDLRRRGIVPGTSKPNCPKYESNCGIEDHQEKSLARTGWASKPPGVVQGGVPSLGVVVVQVAGDFSCFSEGGAPESGAAAPGDHANAPANDAGRQECPQPIQNPFVRSSPYRGKAGCGPSSTLSSRRQHPSAVIHPLLTRATSMNSNRFAKRSHRPSLLDLFSRAFRSGWRSRKGQQSSPAVRLLFEQLENC